jgi:hypothetical protein
VTIYSTTAQQGIDVNAVFTLDPVQTVEYPAPPFQPGELAWGTDGSEWVYCFIGSAVTLAAGNAVFISQFPGAWSVTPAQGATVVSAVAAAVNGVTAVTTTTPLGMLVGVVGGSTGTMAPAVLSGTQTGNYFWVQRAGNCPNLSMTGSGAIMTTPLRTIAAGAGSLTSGAGGGSGTTVQIAGIVWSLATASATGPNTAILNYPYISAAN